MNTNAEREKKEVRSTQVTVTWQKETAPGSSAGQPTAETPTPFLEGQSLPILLPVFRNNFPKSPKQLGYI